MPDDSFKSRDEVPKNVPGEAGHRRASRPEDQPDAPTEPPNEISPQPLPTTSPATPGEGSAGAAPGAPREGSAGTAPGTPPGRFTRVIDLYGAEGFAALRAATVMLIGLGGVGSHAAIALARTGIGRLILVDHDRLTISSLNRFPVAGPDDVGRLKAEFVAEHLARTCPDTACHVVLEFFHQEHAQLLEAPRPNVVADAIDSLNPKVALLEACVRAGIPVVSSMGASARRDPSQLRVGLLGETTGCPLARQVRRRLRRRDVSTDIPCVFSLEEGGAVLPPDPNEPQNQRGRVRNRLPSQMTIPGAFGYALAHTVIEYLVGGRGDRSRRESAIS